MKENRSFLKKEQLEAVLDLIKCIKQMNNRDHSTHAYKRYHLSTRHSQICSEINFLLRLCFKICIFQVPDSSCGEQLQSQYKREPNNSIQRRMVPLSVGCS